MQRKNIRAFGSSSAENWIYKIQEIIEPSICPQLALESKQKFDLREKMFCSNPALIFMLTSLKNSENEMHKTIHTLFHVIRVWPTLARW